MNQFHAAVRELFTMKRSYVMKMHQHLSNDYRLIRLTILQSKQQHESNVLHKLFIIFEEYVHVTCIMTLVTSRIQSVCYFSIVDSILLNSIS